MTELEEGMTRVPFRKDILQDIARVAREIGVSPESVIAEASLRYIESWDTEMCKTWEFKYGFEAGYQCGYTEAWHDKEPQKGIPMFLADEYAAVIDNPGTGRKAWNDYSLPKSIIHYSRTEGKIE